MQGQSLSEPVAIGNYNLLTGKMLLLTKTSVQLKRKEILMAELRKKEKTSSFWEIASIIPIGFLFSETCIPVGDAIVYSNQTSRV